MTTGPELSARVDRIAQRWLAGISPGPLRPGESQQTLFSGTHHEGEPTMSDTSEKILLPLNDPSIDWDDLSTMKELTCQHHPTAKYLTKNPWSRSLHFITPAVEAPFNGRPGLQRLECPCPFSDLRVVAEEARS